MKKILLTLGTVATILVPITTVVASSCSSESVVPAIEKTHKHTFDLTGKTEKDKDELGKLYDEYANDLDGRDYEVSLTLIDESGEYEYTAAAIPGNSSVPDSGWEHLMVKLENLAGKPGVADLILGE